MAFTVPSFPLLCDIYDGAIWPVVVPRLTSVCNLGIGRRATPAYIGTGQTNDPPVFGSNPSLLLPVGTDIRDKSCGVISDYVEVPAGSGRMYQVWCVDDVGKGFSNEFRYAVLAKVYDDGGPGTPFPGFFWPIPIP